MKRSVVCVLVSVFLLMTGCHAESRPPDGTDDRAPAPVSAGETDLQRQEARQVERFDAVRVDVLAANIQVIPGETWSVSYALSEKEPLERFGVEDGTLYVETRFDEKEHFDHSEDYYVVVTVPEGASLTELELDTLSGDVEVRGFTCEEAALSSLSGDVEVKDMEAGELELHSTSGEIMGSGLSAGSLSAETVSSDMALEGELHELEIKTISGETGFTGKISDSAELESTSGDISLAAEGLEKVQAASMGQIAVDGVKIQSMREFSDDARFTVKSVSGGIDIHTKG